MNAEEWAVWAELRIKWLEEALARLVREAEIVIAAACRGDKPIELSPLDRATTKANALLGKKTAKGGSE